MTKITTASLALLMASVAAPAMAQSGPGDWSGFYAGVYGGYLENDDDSGERLVFDRDFDGDFDDTVVLPGGAGLDAFSPGSCSGASNTNAAAGGCHFDGGGVEGGARAGYDMQFGSFVVGAVAEVSGVDLDDSVTSFSTTPAFYTFRREVENVVALRARVGYAFGPALAYVTAGGARAKVQSTFTTSNSANTFLTARNDETADGYQVGAGVEYALTPSLSFVAEYMYTDLEAGEHVVRIGPGTAAPANPFILPPNTAGTDTRRSSDELTFQGFRIGINVRF